MSDSSNEARARESFERNTAEHDMTVLHDDGLYRHLRFKRPETSIYYFDIVTWPWNLVICGDAGTYHFMRLEDMFDFFGDKPGINPYYWGEKLRGPRPGRAGAQSYSADAFTMAVVGWFADIAEDMAADEAASLWEVLTRDVLDNDDGQLDDESTARSLVHDFEHDGHYIVDAWEWDLREFDFAYLWCCWAIVYGIERYRALVSA